MTTLHSYTDRLFAALSSVDEDALGLFVQTLTDTRLRGKTIWIAGNGGSASTAEHMATDLLFGTSRQPPFRALSLASNTASLTATGNDVSFDDVFSRSLISLAAPGDMLVLISASGNSPNLISAAMNAREMGVVVATLTGFDGGRLLALSDVPVHCQTASGDYGVAEDCHLVINHLVKERLRD